MRYFKKTAVGVLALVLLSGLAWKLEQRASQSAADAAPVTEASVPPVEVIAVDLLYREASQEPDPEPTPAIPIYDIPLSAELQTYTYQRCEAMGLVAPGVDYQTVLALMSKESGYTADAVSGTGDYGIMQINTVNHEWLREELWITDFLDAEHRRRHGNAGPPFREVQRPQQSAYGLQHGRGRRREALGTGHH